MGPASSSLISALVFHSGRRVFPDVLLTANHLSEELQATNLSLVKRHMGWPEGQRPELHATLSKVRGQAASLTQGEKSKSIFAPTEKCTCLGNREHWEKHRAGSRGKAREAQARGTLIALCIRSGIIR